MHPWKLHSDMTKSRHLHIRLMERLLKTGRLQVIIAKPKRIFCNQISRPRAPGIIQTQHLLPIALSIFRNLVAQDLELLADDGLEIDNATLREYGITNH